MELRAYQRQAVNAIWDHVRNRSDNPCVVIPTGGGKTPVIASLAADIVRWNRRVIILSHVRELLEQTVDKLHAVAPELRDLIGVCSAGLGSRDTDHPIVVAGIQSAYTRAASFGKRHLAIIDEAHLIPPSGDGMYRTLISGLREAYPSMRVCGLTATPYRTGSGEICTSDGILNEVCYEIGIRELIADGYLCRVRAKGGKQDIDTSGLHIQGGEFVPMDVDFLMNTDDRVGDMSGVRAYPVSSEDRTGSDVSGDHRGTTVGFSMRDGPACTGMTPCRSPDRQHTPVP